MSVATLRLPQQKPLLWLRAHFSLLAFVLFLLLLLRRLCRLARARLLPCSRLWRLVDEVRLHQAPLDWLQLATLTGLRRW